MRQVLALLPTHREAEATRPFFWTSQGRGVAAKDADICCVEKVETWQSPSCSQRYRSGTNQRLHQPCWQTDVAEVAAEMKIEAGA